MISELPPHDRMEGGVYHDPYPSYDQWHSDTPNEDIADEYEYENFLPVEQEDFGSSEENDDEYFEYRDEWGPQSGPQRTSTHQAAEQAVSTAFEVDVTNTDSEDVEDETNEDEEWIDHTEYEVNPDNGQLIWIGPDSLQPQSESCLQNPGLCVNGVPVDYSWPVQQLGNNSIDGSTPQQTNGWRAMDPTGLGLALLLLILLLVGLNIGWDSDDTTNTSQSKPDGDGSGKTDTKGNLINPETGAPFPVDPRTGDAVDLKTGAKIDPNTQHPSQAIVEGGKVIDPETDRPFPTDRKTKQQVDPKTKLPIDPASGQPTNTPYKNLQGDLVNPKTGEVYPVDEKTGQAIDKATGKPIDHQTGKPTDKPYKDLDGNLINPKTGARYDIDSTTGQPKDPKTGKFVDPSTGDLVKPPKQANTGDYIDPATNKPYPKDPQGRPVSSETGKPIDVFTGKEAQKPNLNSSGDIMDPKTGKPFPKDPVTGDAIDPLSGRVIDKKTGRPVADDSIIGKDKEVKAKDDLNTGSPDPKKPSAPTTGKDGKRGASKDDGVTTKREAGDGQPTKPPSKERPKDPSEDPSKGKASATTSANNSSATPNGEQAPKQRKSPQDSKPPDVDPAASRDDKRKTDRTERDKMEGAAKPDTEAKDCDKPSKERKPKDPSPPNDPSKPGTDVKDSDRQSRERNPKEASAPRDAERRDRVTESNDPQKKHETDEDRQKRKAAEKRAREKEEKPKEPSDPPKRSRSTRPNDPSIAEPKGADRDKEPAPRDDAKKDRDRRKRADEPDPQSAKDIKPSATPNLEDVPKPKGPRRLATPSDLNGEDSVWLTPAKLLLALMILLPLFFLISAALSDPRRSKKIVLPPLRSNHVKNDQPWIATQPQPIVQVNTQAGGGIQINNGPTPQQTHSVPVHDVHTANHPDVQVTLPQSIDDIATLAKLLIAVSACVLPLVIDWVRGWPAKNLNPTAYVSDMWQYAMLALAIVILVWRFVHDFPGVRMIGHKIVPRGVKGVVGPKVNLGPSLGLIAAGMGLAGTAFVGPPGRVQTSPYISGMAQGLYTMVSLLGALLVLNVVH